MTVMYSVGFYRKDKPGRYRFFFGVWGAPAELSRRPGRDFLRLTEVGVREDDEADEIGIPLGVLSWRRLLGPPTADLREVVGLTIVLLLGTN